MSWLKRIKKKKNYPSHETSCESNILKWVYLLKRQNSETNYISQRALKWTNF